MNYTSTALRRMGTLKVVLVVVLVDSKEIDSYTRQKQKEHLMRVQEHLKLSSAAAVLALPLLKKDIWIPFASSILIDVDHYLGYAVAHRSFNLKAALRYYGQADPPPLPQGRIFHHPLVLGALLLLAIRLRSRVLALIFTGLVFHVSLDILHGSQMSHLKSSLSKQANNICSECGQQFDALQLHTVHFASNLLERYDPKHFIVLCPTCHEQAHTIGV